MPGEKEGWKQREGRRPGSQGRASERRAGMRTRRGAPGGQRSVRRDDDRSAQDDRRAQDDKPALGGHWEDDRARVGPPGAGDWAGSEQSPHIPLKSHCWLRYVTNAPAPGFHSRAFPPPGFGSSDVPFFIPPPSPRRCRAVISLRLIPFSISDYGGSHPTRHPYLTNPSFLFKIL